MVRQGISWMVSILLSAVVFLIVLLVFLAVWWFGVANRFSTAAPTYTSSVNQNLNISAVEETPWILAQDEVIVPPEEDTTNIQDTSDWQTFESRRMPVSFGYPPDWQMWEGTTPLSDYIQIADYQSKPKDAFKDRIPGHKLEVSVQEQPVLVSLEKWIKQQNADYSGTEGVFEDVTVDGFPAKLNIMSSAISVYGSVYIPLGDGTQRVMVFSVYGPETDFADMRPLLNAFMSTVRITAE